MAVTERFGEWWVGFSDVRLPGRKPRRVQRRSPVQTKKGATAFERELLEREYRLTGKAEKTFKTFCEHEFPRVRARNNSPA